ncbi:hypothetical protein ACQ4XT_08725 [Halobacillus faecis]
MIVQAYDIQGVRDNPSVMYGLLDLTSQLIMIGYPGGTFSLNYLQRT